MLGPEAFGEEFSERSLRVVAFRRIFGISWKSSQGWGAELSLPESFSANIDDNSSGSDSSSEQLGKVFKQNRLYGSRGLTADSAARVRALASDAGSVLSQS
jgi:hypothetical protein